MNATALRAQLRGQLADLASTADEGGDNITCVALLHVIKAMELPPTIYRRYVNSESMLLDLLHEAARR